MVSYFVSKKTSKPIYKLCAAMEKVQNGNLEISENIKGWREIDQLVKGFNAMISKIKQLLIDIRKEEILKKCAEIEALQSQINPHFLHNTLFSIKCLIQMGKHEQAVKMITVFIDLLKLTLKKNFELISVHEEILSIEKYIELQKIRYSNKIDLEKNISPETTKLFIPAMILQPLIENSIFHGIEPKKGIGKIIISTFIEGNTLKILIHDDGIGIEENTIESLNSRSYQKNNKFSSIGISNVDQRIRLKFGESYGLSFEKPESGTTVVLTLPIISESTNEYGIISS